MKNLESLWDHLGQPRKGGRGFAPPCRSPTKATKNTNYLCKAWSRCGNHLGQPRNGRSGLRPSLQDSHKGHEEHKVFIKKVGSQWESSWSAAQRVVGASPLPAGLPQRARRTQSIYEKRGVVVGSSWSAAQREVGASPLPAGLPQRPRRTQILYEKRGVVVGIILVSRATGGRGFAPPCRTPTKGTKNTKKCFVPSLRCAVMGNY